MNSDLINIKDKYGEKMMHLCRKIFSTILENEGQLFGLMKTHFAYSKFLYDDIVNNSLENQFKSYIYSLMEPIKELPVVSETPLQLLEMAGYVLYECHTEEDIDSFKKYYDVDESLCTFRGGRLDECYVFFAVKKDVSRIRREDYIYPQRQDKYGTSVISIQFTKGEFNTLSIKNRYNHVVSNPDATFSNNLENIMPGLTKSFERDYNLNICQNNFGDFEIPGYVKANDGKYYKYNYEINNIYYCPDNIIINNFEVVRDYQEKEKYIIADYFIIDLVNKKISLYDKSVIDSFIDDLGNIKKIYVNRDRNTNSKIIDIIFEDGTSACIELDKYCRITSYKNDNISLVGDSFLYYNKYLERISVPNVMKIGNGFLYSNNLISVLDFPKLLEVRDDFLCKNTSVDYINAPRIITVGNNFLNNNEKLISISMNNLEKVGDNFISKNKIINKICFPNLVYVGDNFLRCNMKLVVALFPKLIYAGKWFISANKIICNVDFSKLCEVGDNFLACNNALMRLVMPNIEKIGNNFLFCNKNVLILDMPNLRLVGNKFLYYNNSLLEMNSSKLEYVGNYFLYMNKVLEKGDFSLLKCYGRGFCSDNNDVKRRVLKIND